MPQNRDRVGLLIRALRDAHRLDRKQLAAQLDVSYPYLANLEYGNRPVPRRLWSGFDSVFGLPPGTMGELVELANLPATADASIILAERIQAVVTAQTAILDEVGALALATSLQPVETEARGAGLAASHDSPQAQLQRLAPELSDEQAEALLAVLREMQRTRRAR